MPRPPARLTNTVGLSLSRRQCFLGPQMPSPTRLHAARHCCILEKQCGNAPPCRLHALPPPLMPTSECARHGPWALPLEMPRGAACALGVCTPCPALPCSEHLAFLALSRFYTGTSSLEKENFSISSASSPARFLHNSPCFCGTLSPTFWAHAFPCSPCFLPSPASPPQPFSPAPEQQLSCLCQ